MEATTKKERVMNRMKAARLNPKIKNEIKRSEFKEKVMHVWTCKNCDSMNTEVDFTDSQKEVFCGHCGDFFTIITD